MSDAAGPTTTSTYGVVALAGNPNTGKTTLFNALTGFRQRVGNYPGVTVEKKTGFLRSAEGAPLFEVVDLPGTYSLAAHSADEAIVLDVLMAGDGRNRVPDVIVCVLDATNLSRNLFLATQLLEIGPPVVVALTMTDLAEASGLRIATNVLSEGLGVPVVPVVAFRQVGIEDLRKAILSATAQPTSNKLMKFPECISAELDEISRRVAHLASDTDNGVCRAELVQSLFDPGGYSESGLISRYGEPLADTLAQARKRIENTGEPIVEVEARARYGEIANLVKCAVSRANPPRRSKTDLADSWLTHRVYGTLFLLVMLAACFQSVYSWAAPLMEGTEGLFGLIGDFAATLLPSGAFRSLVVNGGVAGVGGVLVFLPQILILFLFIAILEDCGYMARAAFLLDRWMGIVGLNGKSLIPLLSCFACAVPGVMATRTIEDRTNRFITILIAPLMSCSARLPIYSLLIGVFIPPTTVISGLLDMRAVALLALYLMGIVIATCIAFVFRRTIFKGAEHPLLLELPTYRWPSAKTVLYRVYEQGKMFCVTAGTMILAVSIVVWALGYYPHPKSIAVEHEARRAQAREVFNARSNSAEAATVDTSRDANAESQAPVSDELKRRIAAINREEAGAYLRQSLLGSMGEWIEPVVKPLGWDWRIGTAVIASFPAREVVIATMGTIYNLGSEQDETSSSLRSMLTRTTWPDGKPVFNIAVALSIMVFFALCCQCAATLATIRRETNSWRWPAFIFAYMTVLAYLGAFVTYQVASRLM